MKKRLIITAIVLFSSAVFFLLHAKQVNASSEGFNKYKIQGILDKIAGRFKSGGLGMDKNYQNSAERAERTKSFLRLKGVPVLETLPLIESEKEAKIRNAKDVARRAIILYEIAGVGFDVDTKETIEAIKKVKLWKYVTKSEKEYNLAEDLKPQAKIENTWKVEAVWTLLWALGKTDKLDFPVEECDVEALSKMMPKFEETQEFINSAKLRSTKEILDASDMIYRIHWATRQADIDNQEPPAGLLPGVVIERHLVLNWLTYYADYWDDVTCDT